MLFFQLLGELKDPKPS